MKHRIAIVAAMGLAMAACSRRGGEERAFQWTDQLPAGAVVHLRSGAGNVVVRRATGQTALVSGSKRWHRGRARDVRFVVKQVGNDYYVCAMWRASGKCGASGYRGRQTGTFLTMFSLFNRTTDAAADFVAEIPANVTVDVKTTTGSVQVDGMTAGVSARTTRGSVEALNVSGPLSLATSTGDVVLVTGPLAESDDIRLSTGRGAIRAELPADLQGTFDLSVDNGRILSDVAVPPFPRSRPGRHLQGQIGSSSRIVKMRAAHGGVTLRTRGPAAE